LLAGAAEAVERHPGRFDGPAGGQYRHPGDVVAVIVLLITVAHDDVVDLGRVEADPVAQPVQHLGQHFLRVQLVQPTAWLSLAPGAANTIDEPRLGHPPVLSRIPASEALMKIAPTLLSSRRDVAGVSPAELIAGPCGS
jgi:hypothetical protein